MGDEISRRKEINELIQDINYKKQFKRLSALENRTLKLLKEEY